MKKRKLTKELLPPVLRDLPREIARSTSVQGVAAIRREMEKIQRRKLTARRLLVQRSATGVLHIGKIHPNWDDPRAVAKGLAQEIFEFPLSGAREVAFVIERRAGKDKRFLGQMLIALGKYLLDGSQVFDDLDVEIADIARQY